ncbi:putative ribonuclease H-like domain-containing protein [Medicago truncatula]|uniref:Putative ribonuclease H-like domain-containing protein n=1 Tax=Medicago truncatula TaxID=3880 RepID=A0A396H2U8_MEDTR|nr:putative ribonuclease H-like domain-containing protein [Medicago truncatula]
MHGIMQDILTLMIEPNNIMCNLCIGNLLLQIISSVTLMHHFLQQKKKVSMGACLRDEKGTFVAALTTYCEVVITIAEGEAWGLYEGIQWISSLRYHNVIFKLDCKMVVDDVHNGKMNLSEYGSIVQNCRTLLDHYNDFVVVFTRRQGNGSAHALAREVLSHVSRSTFDVIPFCIATIIMNETP